jgi:hypothetical protein
VQRGGMRVFELAFGQNGIDYEATHLSALVPEIGSPGIVKILVQRQPDTRLHFMRSDGTVAMLVFDKLEQVICWLEIETDGEIEDAVVLPGAVGEPRTGLLQREAHDQRRDEALLRRSGRSNPRRAAAR